MMPKGYITNINVNPGKIGPERRKEILDNIVDKNTFLPRGVLEEDMDATFIDFVNNDLSITIDGVKVPVIFLTIQRWSEFSKTWQFSDKYKNIELPFITIVRKPDIQQGKNQAGLWNIPGDRTYTFMKVPTWDGIRKGVDLYQIPQPTSVDITYDVRLFTNRMKDLNRLNRKVQKAFQSRQHYVNVKGHPMPLHLETISDESKIDDLENRRFYVQMFNIKLLGYILDEADFKIVPTVNRTIMATEVVDSLVCDGPAILTQEVKDDCIQYDFEFKPKAEDNFSFISKYNTSFDGLVGIYNITRIVISINGVVNFDGLVLTTPLVFNANDTIKIKVYKNLNDNGKFQLTGKLI